MDCAFCLFKLMPYQRPSDFLLYRHLGNLVFLQCKFRPVVWHELILEGWSASRFCFFAVDVRCSRNCFELVFLSFPLYRLYPLSNIIWTVYGSLCSALCADPLTCLSVFLPVSPRLDYSTFYSKS